MADPKEVATKDANANKPPRTDMPNPGAQTAYDKAYQAAQQNKK